ESHQNHRLVFCISSEKVHARSQTAMVCGSYAIVVMAEHVGMLPQAWLTVVKSLARHGISLSTVLFRQPPDFIAHAFPEVDALGGGSMALAVVPPGDND